jgi:hypothetical protein
MRTLRLSLVGTVILMLAGGIPALAQEASPGAVWVTGTATCPTVEEGTTTIVDGVVQHRGMVAECSYTSSDPRVGEPTTNTSDWDCYALTPASAGQRRPAPARAAGAGGPSRVRTGPATAPS